MTDTPPEVMQRYRAMLLARSPEERLKMGCSMGATARALVRASVLARDPHASPAAVRRALFLRLYGREFDAPARERILARLGADLGAEPRASREDAAGDETPAPARRRVPIDWDGLEMALAWRSDELESFLDLRTGAVRHYRPAAFGGDVEPFDLTEEEADDGLAGGDLVRIEPLESRVEYGWMAAFAESVADPRLRARLEAALGGRRPFRRFKDALAGAPAERERWFRFHDARVQEAMREWLEEHGIEPTTAPPERLA